jgi:hypothetical protein
MLGEPETKRGQLKGYLFEIVVLELLRKNGFTRVNPGFEPTDRVREPREGFIEFRGRGCWHQIDCPCDYQSMLPFMYPLRLLGEVKYRNKPLQKSYIREYIGVIKDIQENYFALDGDTDDILPSRKMEIGVYFSANGFHAEAEKLAFAHGIKTISYQNNHLIDRIKTLIEELESQHLSVNCLDRRTWGMYKKCFTNAILHGDYYGIAAPPYNLSSACIRILDEIRMSLGTIRTSFIATTATGVFLHFLSKHRFPEELFENHDDARCRVFYETQTISNEDNRRNYYLTFTNDPVERRFYFSPPKSLNQASVHGGEVVLNEKERLFRFLKVNIMLRGIARNLIFELDRDWMDAVRNESQR